MAQTDAVPLVGVSACIKPIGDSHAHAVQHKYLAAVVDGAAAQPLMIPALENAIDIDAVLAGVDGIMLTGSPSNVEPHHYDGPESRDDTEHDPARDATVLPLIDAALRQAVPLFCICRGIQELNVALGGSLHAHLQEAPGRADHRRNPAASRDDQYAPRHRLAITPGGLLAEITGRTEALVNSLHGQGIDRPAPRLAVEAVAPDGTVEAVSVTDARAFALGVQWHPEWKVRQDPFNLAIFRAFGDACRARAHHRSGHGAADRVA